MAAEHCNIRRGDTVAVWGCGPVGQFAIRSAYMLGADQVIAIDRFPERLQLAKTGPSGRVLDYQEVDVSEALRELTGARTGCSLMP
jgi:threonine dehydrogenase-like Zn-dependent dehydrogenase